jgi:hypothetical protein
MKALRVISRARGISTLAEKTGFHRLTLYNTLREGTNPKLLTLLAIIEGLGFSVRIQKSRVPVQERRWKAIRQEKGCQRRASRHTGRFGQ